VGPTLFFLRHGQAGSRGDWHGDDTQRPLTAEGKKRMAQEAAGIRALGLSLDLIVSSPLVRAYQTAQIVAKAQGNGVGLVRDARLRPGFGPTHLAAILQEHGQTQGMMLVGHEPDFSETVGHVTGGSCVVMKKGSLACVQLDDPASLRGRLVWLIPPKVLER
jgi:phosphohistidine phosphatase